MTLESVAQTPPETDPEGPANLTIYEHVPRLSAAIGLCRNLLTSGQTQNLFIISDFDGPFSSSLAMQANLDYDPSHMRDFRNFLQEYPKTSVIILTSRHLDYHWGTGEKWLSALHELLAIGMPDNSDNCTHSLAHGEQNRLATLLDKTPLRLIITGAAKDIPTRLLELFLGYRDIKTFVKEDILQIDPPGKQRLAVALNAIYNLPHLQNTALVIFDDGVMKAAVYNAASASTIKTIYMKIERVRIGNLKLLIQGTVRMLVHALKNHLRKCPLPKTIEDQNIV